MKPLLSKAGQQLRLQIDDSFPDRKRDSDGWIGNAAHASRKSDHNPDPTDGIVRAIDVDKNLNSRADTMHYLADQIRNAAKKDKRIAYVIFDKRIASAKSLWHFRPYSGSSPHTHHIHISFTKKGDADGSFFNIPMIGGSL